jgi:hypothetical protein
MTIAHSAWPTSGCLIPLSVAPTSATWGTFVRCPSVLEVQDSPIRIPLGELFAYLD